MQDLNFFLITSDTYDEFTYGAYKSSPPHHDWFSPLDDDSRDSDYRISFTNGGYSLVEE